LKIIRHCFIHNLGNYAELKRGKKQRYQLNLVVIHLVIKGLKKTQNILQTCQSLSWDFFSFVYFFSSSLWWSDELHGNFWGSLLDFLEIMPRFPTLPLIFFFVKTTKFLSLQIGSQSKKFPQTQEIINLRHP
jgi:hypothetical protein